MGKIGDPRGQVLFETTAEVLGGLVRAYEDYETRSEEAWREGAGEGTHRMPALAPPPRAVASRKPNSAHGRAPRSLSQ